MRAILRAGLVIVLLLIVWFIAFGDGRGTSWHNPFRTSGTAAGTTAAADAEKVRARGAEFGERAAVAAEAVGNTVVESAITAKIKAKMALDDSVNAGSVNVSTAGSTVTLTGTARSAMERARMIALARETDGVTQVVDRLALLR